MYLKYPDKPASIITGHPATSARQRNAIQMTFHLGIDWFNSSGDAYTYVCNNANNDQTACSLKGALSYIFDYLG